MSTGEKRFVFQDITGRRWKYFKMSFFLFLLILVFLLSVFTFSLFTNPSLPVTKIEKANIEPIDEPLSPSHTNDENLDQPAKEISAIPKENVFVFYNQKDPYSFTSLEENVNSIGVLIPDWFVINSDFWITTGIDEDVDNLARKHALTIIPNVQIHSIDFQRVSSQKRVIKELLNLVSKHNYSGVNLNFLHLEKEDSEAAETFILELAKVFREKDLKVMITDHLANGSIDYEKVHAVIDHVIIHANSLHPNEGPFAEVRKTAEMIDRLPIPREKIVLSLGSYGYHYWNDEKGQHAEMISFTETMQKAAEYDLKIYWENDHSYTRYMENSIEHTIWFTDGASIYNQLKHAANANISKVALHHLGLEDPSLWNLVGNKNKLEDRIAGLTFIDPYANENVQEEILLIDAVSQYGERELDFDGNGFITKAIYKNYPVSAKFNPYGHTSDRIALAFIDSPNSEYTDQILQILKQYDLKATFFISGKNALYSPDSVQQIFKHGHDIAHGTYSDQNPINGTRLFDYELNATQRIIQGITGHSATLLRNSYLASELNENEKNLSLARKRGYIPIGGNLHLDDYNGQDPESVVSEMIKDLADGNIMVLKEDKYTVEMLPLILEGLKKQEIKPITVKDLADKEKEDIIPPVHGKDKFLAYTNKISLHVFPFIVTTVKYYLFVTILIGIIRMLILMHFSYKHKKKNTSSGLKLHEPEVSIIIPVYNEEVVIRRTVRALLFSFYNIKEILVIDDGSTDQTASVVEKEFRNFPKIKVIRKENGGKASALNLGFQKAKGDIIITIDADTILSRYAISNLVRHFQDPTVAAVSGNCKIGNIRSQLTLWQHIEYVTSNNLEKRAYDYLNCMTVVPGSNSAWRKSVVKELGLYDLDTLAEDTDLTLKIAEKGYRIVYDDEALSYEECPETVKSFLEQRFRWSYGILQCLWKHKWTLLKSKNKTLKYFAVPSTLISYLLYLTVPLADLVFLIALIAGSKVIFFFLLFFYLMDSMVSFYSFKLEKENMKPLVWVFIQRMAYRYLISYITWKTVLQILKGRNTGWNKLNRSGHNTALH